VSRRSAVLDDIPIEEQFERLLANAPIAKRSRIRLATAMVEQGLVSQRKARELTGVSRDTIRRRTAPKKQKTKRRNGKNSS